MAQSDVKTGQVACRSAVGALKAPTAKIYKKAANLHFLHIRMSQPGDTRYDMVEFTVLLYVCVFAADHGSHH